MKHRKPPPPSLKHTHTVLPGGHREVNGSSTLFLVFKDIELHRRIEEVLVVVLMGVGMVEGRCGAVCVWGCRGG